MATIKELEQELERLTVQRDALSAEAKATQRELDQLRAAEQVARMSDAERKALLTAALAAADLDDDEERASVIAALGIESGEEVGTPGT